MKWIGLGWGRGREGRWVLGIRLWRRRVGREAWWWDVGACWVASRRVLRQGTSLGSFWCCVHGNKGEGGAWMVGLSIYVGSLLVGFVRHAKMRLVSRCWNCNW